MALAYRDRWHRATEFLEREALARTPEEKLRQFAMLFRSARQFGWVEGLREGEEQVWERWRRLREVTLERAAFG